MKAKIIIIGLLVGWLAWLSPVQAAPVTVDDALSAAKAMFKGVSVNYYLIEDDPKITSTNWRIFVDCDPLKGWEHDCYIIEIPKETPTSPTEYSKTKYRVPPSQKMSPLEINVGDTAAISKPSVKVLTNNYDSEVANRTYAVILSGGININSNKERYWNDCSFVFQALKKVYGVPQENFRVIMADGTNPGVDMVKLDGSYVSSPLDLDGDGVNDIGYSATKQNVSTVLTQLASVMKRDDHLLFYVIDHGGYDNKASKSYICLWNNGQLYDNELASYLKPLLDNNVSVNVVMGQCNSGGFIDDLSEIGCVIATACKYNEQSRSNPSMTYDEFVYHWTCAICGSNPYALKASGSAIINADYNNDGKVSMDEAFAYAKSHDPVTQETPQFYCGPDDYGKYLAFNYLPKSDDLYIKDNPEDVGDEPNYTTDIFWNSPSIWVRNDNDGIHEHQNPTFNDEDQVAYVYSVIHNKGEKRYDKGKWMHLNWAFASTGIHSKTWRGRESYGDYQTGGALESKMIKYTEEDGSLIPVLPNDSIIIITRWLLPESLINAPLGNYHYCLYGRIMDAPTDEVFVEGTIMHPMLSCKEAQKNVTIIRIEDSFHPSNVYVRNIVSTTAPYSLEIIPHSLKDKELFNMANVEMDMSQKIYDAWVRGGKLGEEIVSVPQSQNGATNSGRKIRLLSSNSKIKAVKMNSEEFDLVCMTFDFKEFPPTETKYTIDLIQKDVNGVIIGGETFVIIVPAASRMNIPVLKNKSDNGVTHLSVDSDIYRSLSWFDEEGNILSTRNDLVLAPVSQKQEIKVIGFTHEGENAVSTIIIDPTLGIDNVWSQGSTVHIDLINEANPTTSIRIDSVEDGSTTLSFDIPEGSKGISVDIGSLSEGIYAVTLLIDSEIIDNRKIIINK